MTNKYLEKIAGFEKEAGNWNKIVQRLKSKNPGGANYADALVDLNTRMGGKVGEHASEGNYRKALKVLGNARRSGKAVETDIKKNMSKGEKRKMLSPYIDKTFKDAEKLGMNVPKPLKTLSKKLTGWKYGVNL